MTVLPDNIAQLREKHEFLTFILLDDDTEWKCGIVQNINKKFLTFYDMDKIQTKSLLTKFISYADKWWWESGLLLPIDCFIGQEFDIFQHAINIFPIKSLANDPIGPVYSITDNYLTRVRKRKIDLITRVA